MNEAGSAPACGRLAVELRIMGLLGLLWLVTMAHAAAWLWIAVPDQDLGKLQLVTLLIPSSLGLAALLGTLYGRLPTPRWPQVASKRGPPSVAPLALIGFPGMLIAPLLVLRDRRARARTPQGEEVELAFRQLARIPVISGVAFMAWTGLGLTADAIIIGNELGWTVLRTFALAALWVALVAPIAAMMTSRTRAMLRPELLAAPRPDFARLPEQGELRLKLLGPAAAAGLGSVLAPLLGAWLWSHAVSHEAATQQAREQAVALVALARADANEAIGSFLADHPGTTLVVGDRVYGTAHEELPVGMGLVDMDDDGLADFVVDGGGSLRAIVPVEQPRRVPGTLVVLGIAMGVFAYLLAIVLFSRDVARDLRLATEQVSTVARGEAPRHLEATGLLTREIRQLVNSVDRLVARFTETNVASYVAIEKAQEADRLKSQFLANMSHDLRSPLNSILGFSELLITGIDGDLSEDQLEMIQIVADSGADLLQEIDDILDTAKIEAGRMEFHPEPTPPANLVSRAVTNARKRRGLAELDLETEVAPGLPPVFVDTYRTTQAVENMLVFASEGLENPRLRAAVAPVTVDGERMVEIVISTPHQPATPEQLSAVLSGFYRIPGHHGLGLSLPLAGSIVELQGGSLDIQERDETGAAFVMLLPAPEARRKLRLSATKS